MRAFTTSALEVLGLCCVTVGAVLAWPPLGFVVGGSALIAVGYLLGREPK